MAAAASIRFRQYSAADFDDCLVIFDGNCPEYFALNERQDYAQYLADNPAGYEVYLVRDRIMGACGTWIDPENQHGHISWIMIDPAGQGGGIGTCMMNRVLGKFRAERVPVVRIAASQKSAPFFARFGAVEISRTAEGWGPGLDRVEMQLQI
jgi:ribosomal protein S18 acetylase RimI-like enzyme